MITPNETLQLNELINLKSLSLTKSLLMSPMISDPELKEILKVEADISAHHINELQRFLELSTVSGEKTINNFTEDGGDLV